MSMKLITNFKEFSKYLNDGETLIHINCDEKIKLNKYGNIIDAKDSIRKLNPSILVQYEYWSIYEKPKWYKNIDSEKGVLCWVSDNNNNDKKTVAIMTEHLPENNKYKFKENNGYCWTYATPLTREELDSFNIGIGDE